jgi:hypothetical protein
MADLASVTGFGGETPIDAALESCGVPLSRDTDLEPLVLPWSQRVVEVTRVHPMWALTPTKRTYAGIPNKRVLTGPPPIAHVPPEVAAARVLQSATSAESWWSIWNTQKKGISARTNEREDYPAPVASLLARLREQTRELVAACDRRAAEDGERWRTAAGGSSLTGGVWDVVSITPAGRLRFFECKHAGRDPIRDNQRAFLEAALLEPGASANDFNIISWTELPTDG